MPLATPSLVCKRIRRAIFLLTLAYGITVPVLAQNAPVDAATEPDAGKIILPNSVPDPLEPVNRVIWTFNRGVLTGVVKPSGKVYRFVVRKPMRTALRNAGRNVTYPGRLINNLLQEKWTGARDESYRFFCNTILGLGGLIDVAGMWNIPKSDADFGETFGTWGWKPQAYLMLPIAGPSNERDALGMAADTAANPLTYFYPYSYISTGITYNNLTESVDDYVLSIRSEADPYSILQYTTTFTREHRVVDFEVKGEQDGPSLETLQSVFFTFKDRQFPGRGRTLWTEIPGTGRQLGFTYWMQPKKAPVVYIVPGLGSHRLAGTAIALAELVYAHGFSAVTVSSTYNFEFMERSASVPLPGYTPIDAHDLHVALTEVDNRLRRKFPARLGPRALMGYSMGGFHSLFIAGTHATNQNSLLQFERYVAINTPVRLLHSVSVLDDYYAAPLAWPAGERTDDIRNTFLKVAALSQTSLQPQGSLPFSAVESKFLVGFAFRLILRDTIFTSQLRHNQGVLQNEIKRLRREPVYREILDYSFQDYLQKFLVPYYQTRGIDLSNREALEKASDLRVYTDTLQDDPGIRLIQNADDILLAPEDLAWLQSTFGSDRLTVFERGGHLGNLAYPDVQKAILQAIESLKEAETQHAGK